MSLCRNTAGASARDDCVPLPRREVPALASAGTMVMLLLVATWAAPAVSAPPTQQHALLGSAAPVATATQPVTHSALLLATIWRKAEWIGGETQLRRSFNYSGSDGATTTLFASSLGCHELFLNGWRLGLAVLEPGFSTLYPVRVLYVAHNVSGLVKAGENVIGVRLGSCKYGWQDTYCAHGQRDCAAVKLELVSEGQVVLHTEASSAEWKAKPGPYKADEPKYPDRSLYDGVRYDQALDDRHWCAVSEDASWAPARRITPAWGSQHTQLVPHTMPAIVAHPPQGVAAVSMWRVEPTVFVADFGENVAGFVTVAVPPTKALPGGSTELLVEVEHAEILTGPNGRVFNQFSSPPHSIHDCQHYGSCALQTDRYRLTNLSNGLLLSPGTFTYKGFRYIEIRGLPDVTVNSIRAYIVHSDVKVASTFHSNLTLLNRLDDAIAPTVLGNLVSIPTDCPTREKRGWMGDAQWSAENNAARWNMTLIYRNWVQSMLDTQTSSCTHASAEHPPPEHCLSSNISGSSAGRSPVSFVPDSEQRPACAICCDAVVTNKQRFGCYSVNGTRGVNLSDTLGSLPGVVPFDVVSGWPDDPGYSAAIVTVPHALWRRNGDLITMASTYSGIRAYTDYLLRHLTDGLVQYGMLGDWLSLQNADKTYGNNDVPRISAFSGALSVHMVAEMAVALNESDDGRRFSMAARTMRERYHQAFFKPELGSYGNCSQTANILPLVLGCVPQDSMGTVSAALVASLSQSCTGLVQPTMLTGGVGSRHIWQALTLINRTDLAMRLALKESEPSLGWMINQGPGT